MKVTALLDSSSVTNPNRQPELEPLNTPRQQMANRVLVMETMLAENARTLQN